MITLHPPAQTANAGEIGSGTPGTEVSPPLQLPAADAAGVVWVDLVNPTADDYREVESHIGLELPSRDDMAEIEASSRIYTENGAIFLTLIIPYRLGELVTSTPVTFVITRRCLTTIRYAEMKSFDLFAEKIRSAHGWTSARAFTEVIEIIIDRAADAIERIAGDIEALSHEVFARSGKNKNAEDRLEANVRRIGQRGDELSRLRDALLSMSRGVPYLQEHAAEWAERELHARLGIAVRDITSLQDYDGFLTSKVSFLLDATLGLISIQQNKIIKVFTVISMVFMPPTLIAGIYGMNFKNIPEYDLVWGYPAALGLMLLSAIGPYIYFKRRGWF